MCISVSILYKPVYPKYVNYVLEEDEEVEELPSSPFVQFRVDTERIKDTKLLKI